MIELYDSLSYPISPKNLLDIEMDRPNIELIQQN